MSAVQLKLVRVASVSLVGLLWLYFHPIPGEQVSFLVVAISLCSTVLLLPLSRVGIASQWPLHRPLIISVGAVFGIAVVSSQIVLPGIGSFRGAIVVAAVSVLGYALGVTLGLRSALAGVLAGSVLVALLGWLLRADDGLFLTLDLFTGDGSVFRGLAGNRQYEFFSSLLGVAAGLELIRRTERAPWVPAALVLFLAFTVVATGSVTGLVSLVAVFLTAGLLMFLPRNGGRTARIAPIIGATAAAGLSLFMVTNRGLSADLAGSVGKEVSLDARIASWQYALQTIDLPGWVFGHGVSFWSVESPYRRTVGTLLAEDGYISFSHAHSAFLDLFLSLGLLGLGIIGAAVVLTHRVIRQVSRTQKLKPVSFVWTLLSALVVSGLVESIASSRPSAWFMIALVAAAYIADNASPPQGKPESSGATLWAPSGSNRRPTD